MCVHRVMPLLPLPPAKYHAMAASCLLIAAKFLFKDLPAVVRWRAQRSQWLGIVQVAVIAAMVTQIRVLKAHEAVLADEP